ncbi:N-acetyltransferase [Empedobacter stercoris]|uniref:N-acetyltransferase n=2 Tax=Empedobacter TaxID=59734 RepID=A0ABY8V5B9_9FLAO|nr:MULTISPECIES: GNAT family N-acetyltransferase [Empedobacter]MDM1522951.1 N-acetyltransferase [Empedobacter sp. 225-1]MDM1542983.1 N-acetyltransferase [Empedobacter sp. 189-2]NOJ74626.1 N-acetyltransferase [Empedobacter stercoris]UWX66690.1 N-acetyltransferase [Empedobacter stercoris]WIH96869.1 N-acetyltransferase [Empedobacter falsenii]
MKIELNLEGKNGVFVMTDDNNKEVGELTFMLKEEQMIVNHTGVNPELRGKGLAEKLVLEAVKYARKNQLKIIPFCSYVSVYIGKHPEVQDVI